MGFEPEKKEKEEVVIENPTEEIKKEMKKKVTKVEKAVKKNVKNHLMVVKELPTQVVRETVAEDGTIINFITVEEALTQLMSK